MQSCIPIEDHMLCCIFSIIRIITILFFYLALTHLPKLKRGQGQTSVILLGIKFYWVLNS